MIIKKLVLALTVIAIVAGLALAPLPLTDSTRIANSTTVDCQYLRLLASIGGGRWGGYD